MKKLFILLCLYTLVFCACQKYDASDLQGCWGDAYTIGVPDNIWELRFNGDSIEIIGNEPFTYQGTYKLDKDTIIAHFGFAADLKIPICSLNKDSLELCNGNILYKFNPDEHNNRLEPFKLVGISTGKFLEEDMRQFSFCYYRDGKDSLRLRFGEDFVQSINEGAYMGGHQNVPNRQTIFVGEGIRLADLLPLYYSMAQLHIEPILVLNSPSFNQYEIFNDHIDIWWEDMVVYLALHKLGPPPPPPSLEESARKYYVKPNTIEISISSKDDFYQLSKMDIEKKYLISINKGLPLIDYISLKQQVFDLRKKKFMIRTEII